MVIFCQCFTKRRSYQTVSFRSYLQSIIFFISIGKRKTKRYICSQGYIGNRILYTVTYHIWNPLLLQIGIFCIKTIIVSGFQTPVFAVHGAVLRLGFFSFSLSYTRYSVCMRKFVGFYEKLSGRACFLLIVRLRKCIQCRPSSWIFQRIFQRGYTRFATRVFCYGRGYRELCKNLPSVNFENV